jgi:hypothetical protein
MTTVYFLGAGASAADGLPVTSELNFGVASWLSDSRRKPAELRTYLQDIYGVSRSDLRDAESAWRAFTSEVCGARRRSDSRPPIAGSLSATVFRATISTSRNAHARIAIADHSLPPESSGQFGSRSTLAQTPTPRLTDFATSSELRRQGSNPQDFKGGRDQVRRTLLRQPTRWKQNDRIADCTLQRTGSSAGESVGQISRRSEVQALPCPP